MRLQALELRDFRNYATLDLSIDSRLTFLTGPNANGKTNILEAIALLALGKSFRGASDQDMQRDGASGYYAGARFEKGGAQFELSYGVSLAGAQIRRRVRLNGKQLQSRQELIGHIVAVIFSPDDILIAEGGPAYRRRFLDMVLSYQSPSYLKQLLHYNRALRQRNAALKKVKARQARLSDVGIWDTPLSMAAKDLVSARQAFIANFQSVFQEALRRISGDRDSLSLRLQFSSPAEENDLAQALQQNAVRDAAIGFTTVGPHRHNLLFESGGRDVLRFGSQGQRRSLALALRIAQFFYLRESLGYPPLLLIDDVIRELDARRRAAFVMLLRESGQALFTTPDLEGMERDLSEFSGDISIYEVSEPGIVQSRR
ncbi:MAG: DNA replication and repair protein RecF [Leptospirales bacterium]|nr:DNA replication and repair protein RecF [Leptospirales bacterium]